MNYLLTNKIVALFMGKMDLSTGKWFPFQKMTWEAKKDTNYLNCSISFIEGAKAFRRLYPKSENVISYGEVKNYPDLFSSPWRNRMPLSRPLELSSRNIYGFDLNKKIDPIKYVAISGGYRHGDRNCLFPELAPDERGNYNFIFRGVDSWYMPSENKPEIETIPIPTQVTLKLPCEIEIEPGEWKEYTPPPEAIRMKMYAKGQLVGYAPQYIQDLYLKFGDLLQVETYHKNEDVPFDDQFLFKATINQMVGIPFSEAKYQTFTIDSKAMH